MEENQEFGSGLRAHLGFEHGERGHQALPAPEPVTEADPREEELARRLAFLAAAEDALVERERRVAEREEEAERRAAELAEQEHTFRAAVDVRHLLRNRAEQHAEGVWRSFEGALTATTHDGSPDHALRLAAARALLAEAYTDAGAEALEDELAELRARRSASRP